MKFKRTSCQTQVSLQNMNCFCVLYFEKRLVYITESVAEKFQQKEKKLNISIRLEQLFFSLTKQKMKKKNYRVEKQITKTHLSAYMHMDLHVRNLLFTHFLLIFSRKYTREKSFS